ncbi:MAG: hypothetical protein WCL07_03685 [bacterium]
MPPSVTLHQIHDCNHPEANGKDLRAGRTTDLVTIRPEQLAEDGKSGEANCVSAYIAMIEQISRNGKFVEGKCTNIECPWNQNHAGLPAQSRK